MSLTPQLFQGNAPDDRCVNAVTRTLNAYPGAFSERLAARRLLDHIILPRSRRWSFLSVGKNASTSALRFLFQAEFGATFSTALDSITDINPDAAVHALADHGVFARAFRQGLSIDDLLGPEGTPERLCIVRDPMRRAVSGFRYLCVSHREKAPWFFRDRARMNAVVGFDWTKDTDTATGFEKFLDYIAWQIEHEGPVHVDAHWQPQKHFIKPDVYRPTLIGRMEQLGQFFETLSERLCPGCDIEIPRANAQAEGIAEDFDNPSSRARVEAIYRADYEAFGY